MSNKFNDTLNKLMTSTQYQNQKEVLRDLKVLREEYALLYNISEVDRETLANIGKWMTDAKEDAISADGHVWSIYSIEVDLINRFFEEFSIDKLKGVTNDI